MADFTKTIEFDVDMHNTAMPPLLIDAKTRATGTVTLSASNGSGSVLVLPQNGFVATNNSNYPLGNKATYLSLLVDGAETNVGQVVWAASSSTHLNRHPWAYYHPDPMPRLTLSIADVVSSHRIELRFRNDKPYNSSDPTKSGAIIIDHLIYEGFFAGAASVYTKDDNWALSKNMYKKKHSAYYPVGQLLVKQDDEWKAINE